DFEPFRKAFAHVLLEEGLALDAVWVTSENERAALEEGKDVVGDLVVVGEQVSFGVAGFREVDLVEIREAQALAVDFAEERIGSAFEEFGFDFFAAGDDVADNRGCADDVDAWRGSGFGFPAAVFGADVFAEALENGMAQRVFLGPAAEL